VLITRMLRQIDDFLIRLEPVVVRCICSLGDACIEGFGVSDLQCTAILSSRPEAARGLRKRTKNKIVQKSMSARDRSSVERVNDS
jgi:hypothetical protein